MLLDWKRKSLVLMMRHLSTCRPLVTSVTALSQHTVTGCHYEKSSILIMDDNGHHHHHQEKWIFGAAPRPNYYVIASSRPLKDEILKYCSAPEEGCYHHHTIAMMRIIENRHDDNPETCGHAIIIINFLINFTSG